MLVEVAHDSGTAAIVRHVETGQLWLTADLEDGEWTDLEGFEWEWEEHEDSSVWGGAAPHGARTAEIRDVGGDVASVPVTEGAWLFVPENDPELVSVLFKDEEGGVVRPPGGTAEPLAEATEECPACSGRSWELVSDQVHSGQMITCARCGWQAYRYHELPEDLEGVEIPEGVRKLGRAVGKVAVGGLKRLEAHLIGSIDFDVYGLGTWAGPRSVASYSTAPIRVESIELHHGDPESSRNSVLVGTRRENGDERLSPADLAASTLDESLRELHPELSAENAPASSGPVEHLRAVLEREASYAELDRRVSAAQRATVSISVGGVATEFLSLSAEGITVAAAAHGDLDLTVTSIGPLLESLDLVVIDIEDIPID